MKLFIALIISLALLGVGCSSTQTIGTSNLVLTSDLETPATVQFIDTRDYYSFSYPKTAAILPGCLQFPLRVEQNNDTARVIATVQELDQVNKECDLALGDQTIVTIAARKVSREQEMEKFIQEFAQDPDCQGIELNPIPDSLISNIFVENIDITDPSKCDMYFALAQWNKDSGVMVIYPEKNGDAGWKDAIAAVVGSLKF